MSNRNSHLDAEAPAADGAGLARTYLPYSTLSSRIFYPFDDDDDDDYYNNNNNYYYYYYYYYPTSVHVLASCTFCVCRLCVSLFCCFHRGSDIVAIFYPFSQFCEIDVSPPSLQSRPKTAPHLFQRVVEYGEYGGRACRPPRRPSRPLRALSLL